jgi:sodium/potassium/calcium exchanger 6
MFCKFTYRNRVPDSIKSLCLFTFVMSIFWIWYLANILIDILNVFGILYDVQPSFLAMTLLSLGNSLPDLSLNCALARAGFGEMGIAGSVAGPLFNMLIGLGASMIRKTINGPIEFEIFRFSRENLLIAFGILLLNLIRLLIQAAVLNFRLTKSVSIIGYILYALFFIGICIMTFIFH